MALLHVFKNSIPSCNYIFGSPEIAGKVAVFVSGVYRTDVTAEIEELQKEVALGHPHIYVDSNETTIDSVYLDPMVALREKIISEYLAAQTQAVDPTNDRGSSDQAAVKPANTQDIAVAAAGGATAVLSPKLATLNKDIGKN